MRPARGLQFALLLAVFVPAMAGARVFSYKDAGVAAYLRGTAGQSKLNQDQFANADGGMHVDERSIYQYGGELGAVIALGSLQIRIGAEVMQHRPTTQANGSDANGTALYTLDSSVFVFNPNVTFEYSYSGSGNLRYYGALGGGYANVTVVNSYKMLAPGTAKWSVADYDEKAEANVYEIHGEVGLETLFTDNVTFLTGIGYRYLEVPKLRYKGDVNTIQNPGGVKKGDTVLNDDGSTRRLNLGGLFASVGFRFYLNFL